MLVSTIYMEKYKNLHKSNKIKLPGTTRDEELEFFFDRFYSVSDIQDHLDYIAKNMKHLLIIFQSKSSSPKLKIESYLI